MTARFVKTIDIDRVVKADPVAVIVARGIPWVRGQRNKIDCPYPSHGSASDWRIDERTGFVHCTCNTKHSVLDCLSMLRGDDPKSRDAFEESKIEAAELLNRHDLIMTRRDTSAPPVPGTRNPPTWHNGFDGAKLLNPPAHLRNDDLYLDYMSARLGISRDQVPTPATPMVGISALDYFDPDENGGTQRKPVASLPCIVFGMIGLSGELTGTLRIYLDPTGRAKALLGKDAKGQERPVKLFSRGTKVGGEIRFGNVTTATVKVGCEGVENGAAIAYAAATMDDQRVLVACGGTASFMAGLSRQEDVKRLIAAADRDEVSKDPTKPASKAGEKAAIRLLTRHLEDVSPSLALPGKSGEKVDWLDILRRGGVGAVFTGVFNSPVWEPPAVIVAESPEVAEGPRFLEIGSDVELAGLALAELERKHGKIIHAEGSFWRYGGTHWVPFDESSLRLHIHSFDGSQYATAKGVAVIKLSKRQIDSILNEMTPIAARNGNSEMFSETATGINCRNGFIQFDDEGRPTLVPHSPEHRCRHVIAADWSGGKVNDARKSGSLLSKLLTGCVQRDPVKGMTERERMEATEDAANKIKVIAEIMGSAALGMATRIKAPKAVVLLGLAAENGKSQVLDIIRGLLPENAVSSLAAGKMGDEKHLVQLAGKLLNTSDELSSAESIAGDNFKKIVTGNHIEARDVYKSAISFKPKAQHVFATNGLPSFKGGIDRGVRRRLIVIEFNRTIPESERIAEIGLRIASEETELLLDFAVEGAARLIRQGKFTDLKSSEVAVNKWVLQTDPVEAWLSECVNYVVGNNMIKIKTSVAYAAFREWCAPNGYNMIPPINKFSERVEGSGKGYGRVRDSAGRYFTNMVIVEDGTAFQSFGSPL